jgi:radical SAM superfamily enzyme YgiQ (UPF0313 family)
LPDDALQHCDYVVRGEGEETVVELLEALSDGGKPYGVKGVSFWDGNQIVHNPPRSSFAFGIETRLQKLTVDEVGMEF